MPIRIIRNESANCITFQGTSVPAYFNACLSGEVSSLDPDKVNIKNDIRSADQQKTFTNFQIYTIQNLKIKTEMYLTVLKM